MAAGRVLVRGERGPWQGAVDVVGGGGGGGHWGGGGMGVSTTCWDPCCRPVSVSWPLALCYLYPVIYILVPILFPYQLQFCFSSVFFGLLSCRPLKSVFRCQASSALTVCVLFQHDFRGVGTSRQFACCLNTTFNPSLA
jgi:hypothetical protein